MNPSDPPKEPHLTKGTFHRHTRDLLGPSPKQSALGGTLGAHRWAAELLHKGQIQNALEHVYMSVWPHAIALPCTLQGTTRADSLSPGAGMAALTCGQNQL